MKTLDDCAPHEWDQAVYLANLATNNAVVDLTPRDVERLNQLLDQPFGEVPLVTRAYVFLLWQMDKIGIDVRDDDGWFAMIAPAFGASGRYRVVPIEPPEKPKTRPSIDWSALKPEYRWLARDESGTSWAYREEPRIHKNVWLAVRAPGEVSQLASYVPGDCDWKDSLVERPA